MGKHDIRTVVASAIAITGMVLPGCGSPQPIPTIPNSPIATVEPLPTPTPTLDELLPPFNPDLQQPCTTRTGSVFEGVPHGQVGNDKVTVRYLRAKDGVNNLFKLPMELEGYEDRLAQLVLEEATTLIESLEKKGFKIKQDVLGTVGIFDIDLVGYNGGWPVEDPGPIGDIKSCRSLPSMIVVGINNFLDIPEAIATIYHEMVHVVRASVLGSEEWLAAWEESFARAQETQILDVEKYPILFHDTARNFITSGVVSPDPRNYGGWGFILFLSQTTGLSSLDIFIEMLHRSLPATCMSGVQPSECVGITSSVLLDIVKERSPQFNNADNIYDIMALWLAGNSPDSRITYTGKEYYDPSTYLEPLPFEGQASMTRGVGEFHYFRTDPTVSYVVDFGPEVSVAGVINGYPTFINSGEVVTGTNVLVIVNSSNAAQNFRILPVQ